ncbi:MAG: CPBP family intramembrane metalloprotease [Bacteroidetes bacterium]|nr:CPBP family intramembrane metalloprotease [Bacteroidota bacterium]
MPLRCTKCGRELPSEYWFKLPGICIHCFPMLSSEELSERQENLAALSKPQEPFPSLVQAFVLLPFLFLVLFALGVRLENSLGESTPERLRFMLFYLVSLGPLVIFALGVAASRGRTFRSMFSLKWPPAKLLLQIIAIVLIAYFSSAVIAAPLVGPFESAPAQVDVFAVITMLFLAPVLEETLFRGIVLDSFLKRMTAGKAICASSILFALFHINPVLILMGLPLGLLFGWLYFRSGSVLPCIAVHAIVNGISLTITFIALGAESSGVFDPSPTETVLTVLGSLSALVAIAFWLRYVDRKLAGTVTAPA